ncbi:MAG: putative Ig domain-containing protein [Anaerolineae bacterium]
MIIKTGESYDGSGNSAAKVELSSERRIGADLTYFSIDTATISDAINTQVITLRMVIDPATGRATGFYSLDGTTFTQIVDSDTPANDSVIVSDGYFAGVTLPDGTTGPVSFAGVFGSHRNADPEDTIDYAFEYFMVDGTNEAPVLDPLVDQENNEGDTGIAVLVTATDPEDDDLAFAASGLPAGLTIDPDTGLITGDLGFDTAGIYSVEITVTDDGAPARTTTGTFSWIANPVNRSPVVTPLPDRTDAEGDAVSFQVEAVDPDDDPLLYSADNLPEGVLIDENTGLISGVLEADAGGVYEVVVTATDDKNASDSTVFTWTVTFTGNLMRNASFEDGFDDWNQIGRVRIDVEASQFLFVSDTDCDAPSPVDGTCVMVFESTGVIEAVEQTIPVIAGVAGDSYTLTYWVSSEGVFGSSVQGVLAAWSNNVTDEIGTQLCTFNITGTTPMTQVTCPFTTTFDYDRLNIKLGASINNGQYVVDDVVLLKD